MPRLQATIALALAVLAVPARGQAPLEYQVKAAYLYNFVKFVEWPAGALTGPLTICTAAPNPFGGALEDIVRGELIAGHPIATRIVEAPVPGCNVLFVPRGAAAGDYLRGVRMSPVLTVGESKDFVAQGGIISFVLDAGMIRFEIDQEAARRAGLQVSSRLLRLARVPERRASP